MSTLLNLVKRMGPKGPGGFAALGVFLATLSFFFISGACGLLYQVVWTRKLVLLFGTTAYAVSTVLSIFFLGLGLGSIWGGRLADRCKRPLALYGWFEIIIGLWALLFILFITQAEGLVVSSLSAFASARLVGVLLRGTLALAFLLVPVTLMGATLPLLAKFVALSGPARGRRIGALYSINTFGAVTGCAVTGFVLIANLGYTQTTLVGAAANVVAGLLAIVLARFLGDQTPRPDETEVDLAEGGEGVSRRHVALIIIAFALSGFCALGLEVLWTRLLVLVFKGTTYAFTTMLTSLLCGIALGSGIASLLVEKVRRPGLAFGIIEIFLGVFCIQMVSEFAQLPDSINALLFNTGREWEAVTRGTFWLSFSVLFMPTFLFGMTFPFVVKAVTLARSRLGRDIGHLYSANTFGGVLGSLAGGFLIIPLLGTHTGIVVLSCMLFCVGVMVVLSSTARTRAGKPVVIALGVGAMALAIANLPDDIGMSLNRGYLSENEKIIHYREGVEGTVVVTDEEHDADGTGRYLWINAMQATASIEQGVRMNRLQGALPLLFDRDPRHVLFMCFGSGITAGTLGISDEFDRIDAVELSRDVLEAAPLFEVDNLKVLENPRVNFIVDDGRNFLLTTENHYDVITFEPMPLAQAGVSTFYTKEYYELCLEHLKPGGLVSQWVPLHSLNPEIVRSLVATFTSVFPEYCMWFVNADLFLIGSNEPLAMDYATIEHRMNRPQIRQALSAVGFHDIPELIACFFMTKEKIDEFARGGTVMTDDRPWAEFVAPKLVYEDTVADSMRMLNPFFDNPLGLMRFDGMDSAAADRARAAVELRCKARALDLEGLVEFRGGMMGGDSGKYFMQALDIDPNDGVARHYLTLAARGRGQLAMRWKDFDAGIAYLEQVLPYIPNDLEVVLTLGELYFQSRKFDKALEMYSRYEALGGDTERVEKHREAIVSGRARPAE